MARVIVVPDPSYTRDSQTVLMDERVAPEHLDSEHSSKQFIERIAWAIADAQNYEGNRPLVTWSRARSRNNRRTARAS